MDKHLAANAAYWGNLQMCNPGLSLKMDKVWNQMNILLSYPPAVIEYLLVQLRGECEWEKKLHFRWHHTLTSRNYHSFSKTTSLWYSTEWVINLMFCMQQGYWETRDSFVKAGARKGLSSPVIDPSTGFPPDAWIGKQIARIYQLLLLFWGAQKGIYV